MLDHVWIRHTCCFQLLQQQKDAPFLAKLVELLQQKISGWLSQDGPVIGIDIHHGVAIQHLGGLEQSVYQMSLKTWKVCAAQL